MNSDTTIELKTTAAELWPLLVEPANIRLWHPDVVSDEPLTSGPPGVGSKSAVLIREGSREVEYVSEVLTFEPQQRLVILAPLLALLGKRNSRAALQRLKQLAEGGGA